MRSLALHSVFLAHHVFTALYMETVDFTGETHSYLVNSGFYKWRFATIWNFALQIVFLSVCVLDDLMMSLLPAKTLNSLRRKAKVFLSFVFTAMIFPIACSMTVHFWALYWYDRELIYPTVVDAKIPMWVNHSIHTVVSAVALGEIFLVHRPHHCMRVSLLALHSYHALYAVMSLITYWVSGTWVYPMFDIFTWSQRAVVFATTHLGSTLMFFIGWAINRAVWGSVAGAEPSKKKQKKKGK